MAKEYIEREVAIETLYYNADETCSAVVPDFEAIPAADVAPVVHGMWVYAKTYYDIDECNCSLCGQLMTTAIDKRMNYCPNCGAKMDGGAKDAAD